MSCCVSFSLRRLICVNVYGTSAMKQILLCFFTDLVRLAGAEPAFKTVLQLQMHSLFLLNCDINYIFNKTLVFVKIQCISVFI